MDLPDLLGKQKENMVSFYFTVIPLETSVSRLSSSPPALCHILAVLSSAAGLAASFPQNPLHHPMYVDIFSISFLTLILDIANGLGENDSPFLLVTLNRSNSSKGLDFYRVS